MRGGIERHSHSLASHRGSALTYYSLVGSDRYRVHRPSIRQELVPRGPLYSFLDCGDR